jgi:hemerythrin
MGSIVKWDDSYSVFLKDLDNQHKKMFDIINKFYADMAENKTNHAIVDAIKEMRQYSLLHFTYEETVMRRKNFPRFKSHKLSHDEFIKKVSDLEKKAIDGQLVSVFDIANFLRDWLINHIKLEDKTYANYFKNNDLL